MTPVGDVLEKLGVRAERRGSRWWGEECPLPSHGRQNAAHAFQNFFVRDDQSTERPGAFFCFSCKGGGTLLDLVRSVLGATREEAAAWLATIGDRPPPPVVRIRFETSGPRAFRMPDGVEFRPLSEWISPARDYAESRGITADQVDRWGVGVALEGRLENRIVFPVRDRLGRLANYSARTFVDDPVRYLAASRGEHPDLSAMWGEELWGPVEARAAVVAFEGVLNGFAIERALAGERASLGSLQGSAPDHRKLYKLATFPLIVVATDNDPAGDKAARHLFSALSRHGGRRLVRASFPPGRDACDMDPAKLRAEILSCLSR